MQHLHQICTRATTALYIDQADFQIILLDTQLLAK